MFNSSYKYRRNSSTASLVVKLIVAVFFIWISYSCTQQRANIVEDENQKQYTISETGSVPANVLYKCSQDNIDITRGDSVVWTSLDYADFVECLNQNGFDIIEIER